MTTNKLNIALIGYGKMGKTIEKVAISRGHRVGLIISSKNVDDLNAEKLEEIDAAIEFSVPQAAKGNLLSLAAHKIPTACGTTAWLEAYEEVAKAFQSTKTGFLYASNFSIGVNVFFSINKQLAAMMNGLTEYNISMKESHHITKLDAPSGTAATLAEQICASVDRVDDWTLEDHQEHSIPIEVVREEDVKGDHEIKYTSPIDQITIRHEAFTREGFALGAVIAAEFIAGKTDIHTMADVLQIPNL